MRAKDKYAARVSKKRTTITHSTHMHTLACAAHTLERSLSLSLSVSVTRDKHDINKCSILVHVCIIYSNLILRLSAAKGNIRMLFKVLGE